MSELVNKIVSECPSHVAAWAAFALQGQRGLPVTESTGPLTYLLFGPLQNKCADSWLILKS